MEPNDKDLMPQSWLEEMKRGNDLTAELIRVHKDWRLALRQGLLAGFAGAMGATVLVSILVWMLQPLKQLEAFKPALDRIARELERGPSR